jgi:hypothetical protein
MDTGTPLIDTAVKAPTLSVEKNAPSLSAADTDRILKVAEGTHWT